MERGTLSDFFNPRTIAIIGASDHIDKVGGILMKKVLASKLEVIPVNVSHDSIFGKKCYKSVLDFGGNIDLAVIAIPVKFVAQSLEECGKKKIRNVIIISSGFSEGEEDPEKLVKIAKKYDLRFLGTNCFGVCNPSRKLDLTFAANMPRNGKIAFISQSGALWSYISDYGDLGFSNFVSLGNMENLDFNDFIKYFSKDKNTKAIVLYVEKFKDGQEFINVCKKAIKRGKKIYAIKGGSSSVGEKAEISHTASVASDYAIYSGVFKQAGVIQCDSFLEMFEKASGQKINYDNVKMPAGSSFILTNAGGAGVLLSDYLSKKGVGLVEKPMDILGTAMSADYAKAMSDIVNPARGSAMSGRKKFENLYVVVTPQSMTDIENIAWKIVEFSKELKRSGKRVVGVFLGKKSVKKANEILKKNGVEFVNNIEEIGI
jgi:acyl-CoA synthetase (NDP forming)